MKKTGLIKIVFIVGIIMMVLLFSTNVFAAESSSLLDGNTPVTELTLENSNANANANANANVNANANANANASNTNTSIYNNTNNTNTNLPKTGIGDSFPVAMLVVVFGISAVYAYKKIKDYRNI